MSALVATATSATPWMETEKNCDTVKIEIFTDKQITVCTKGNVQDQINRSMSVGKKHTKGTLIMNKLETWH